MLAITQSRYGRPDVLRATQRPMPTPGPTDVLIAIHAAGVTQGDRRLRSGDFPGITFIPGRLMMGLFGPRSDVGGSVFAGRIVAIGDQVTRFAVGDDVFGLAMEGAYAERLCLPEDASIALMPEGWTHAEAAPLAFTLGTARGFLDDMVGLQEGERIAILGAAGAVGRAAVQPAHHRGAHVTAVVRNPDEVDWRRALGADEITTLEAWTGGYDVVFDTAGLVRPAAALARLPSYGRFATLMLSMRVILAMIFGGWPNGPRTISGVATDSADTMDAVRALAEQGVVTPRLARTFALSDVASAHAHLEQVRPHGDVVVLGPDAMAPATLRVA